MRLVGPSLTIIVRDVALKNAQYASISDVVIGPADASGWKLIRPGEYSWAWHLHRQRSSGANTALESQGTSAILIGLLLPATDPNALKLLRPYLAAGARLHLVAGHKFTLEPHLPASFHGYDAGFTGGVFVAG